MIGQMDGGAMHHVIEFVAHAALWAAVSQLVRHLGTAGQIVIAVCAAAMVVAMVAAWRGSRRG